MPRHTGNIPVANGFQAAGMPRLLRIVEAPHALQRLVGGGVGGLVEQHDTTDDATGTTLHSGDSPENGPGSPSGDSLPVESLVAASIRRVNSSPLLAPFIKGKSQFGCMPQPQQSGDSRSEITAGSLKGGEHGLRVGIRVPVY